MLLDTGCTTFIISAHFAQRIGIKEVVAQGHELLLGYGSMAKCLGVAKGLIILVGNVVAATIDALCMDVDDKFDFIIGHPGFQQFGIGVDHTSGFWYFHIPSGAILPAAVYYAD